MTDNFENKVAVDGPVVNEGELGSSTFSPDQVSPAGPLGLGLADGSRLPVSVGPLHQPDQVLGHPAVLRLRRTAPDQRRRREVQSHAQGTDHPWPHLPQHRGAAERRPRVRRTVQCPVDRGEERLPEPRSSSSGVAHRDVTQARRMRQTCVQGTGCDTGWM